MVQNVVNEPVLQVGEDDINLNTRRVVLNFGEKADDAADSDSQPSYKGSDGVTSAGSQTPSHHSSSNTGYAIN